MFVCNHLCPANSIYLLSCPRGMKMILISPLTQIFSVRMYVMHHVCAVGHIKDPVEYAYIVYMICTCACMPACLLLSYPFHMHSSHTDRCTCTHSHTSNTQIHTPLTCTLHTSNSGCKHTITPSFTGSHVNIVCWS